MIGSLDRPRTLRWLMGLRAVVAATLLICSLAINLIFSPEEALTPFYLLAAAVFVLTLLSAAGYSRWREASAFAAAQVAGDLLLVSGFVWASGGLRSPMSFLYLLPIVAAGLTLPHRGAYVVAAAAWVCQMTVVLGSLSGVLPEYPPGISGSGEVTPQFLWYLVVSHLLGFLFSALLSNHVADRLRAAGEELALRHSDIASLQALNENIVESITSGLITTDPAGRVTFVNPAGAAILKLHPAEVAGDPVSGLLGLEDDFVPRLQGILGGERRYRFERNCHLRGGEDRYLGIAASVLRDRSGSPLGLIFTFQDLTEIVALEREVRLKERMASLGEMAAGMAHELRNPLASISGSVQVLQEALAPEGESAELMNIILRESVRLDHAIRDFLTFARPGPFSPEPCDLVRLITDSIRLLRNSREFRSGHRIETVFCAPEVVCEIDVNRAKQVFWNLATNALKAMPGGGVLTIRVDLTGADRVTMTFADQGVGMNEEQTESFFQPFQGEFADGTGLGAAIVYRIVQEHRGSIDLRSAPGRGTAITVTLPAGVGATGAAPASLEAPEAALAAR